MPSVRICKPFGNRISPAFISSMPVAEDTESCEPNVTTNWSTARSSTRSRLTITTVKSAS